MVPKVTKRRQVKNFNGVLRPDCSSEAASEMETIFVKVPGVPLVSRIPLLVYASYSVRVICYKARMRCLGDIGPST